MYTRTVNNLAIFHQMKYKQSLCDVILGLLYIHVGCAAKITFLYESYEKLFLHFFIQDGKHNTYIWRHVISIKCFVKIAWNQISNIRDHM